MTSDNRGLWSKFIVRDHNGESLPSGTFVLRPFNSDGSVNDRSAVHALRAYADNCLFDGNEQLAKELTQWLDNPVDHEATEFLNR